MLKRMALLVLAVFLAAGVPIPRSAPLPQHSPTQSKSGTLPTKNGQTQIRPSAPTPPPEIINAVSRAINAAAHKAEADLYPRPPDKSAWWFNFFLVVFTGGLVVVGAFQAIFLKASVDATGDAAKAARLTAESAVAAERAYLILEGSVADNFESEESDKPPPYIARFELKNYGKTPAILKMIQHTAAYRADADPSQIPIKLVPFAPEIAIGSGEKTGAYPTFLRISATDLARAIEGDGRIFLLGRFEYEDIFGAQRELGFCYQYSPDLIGFTLYPSKTLNYRT